MLLLPGSERVSRGVISRSAVIEKRSEKGKDEIKAREEVRERRIGSQRGK